LVINTNHAFFTHLYSASGSNERLKAGLECLLFVMAVRELEVTDDLAEFYQNERNAWSLNFARVLKALEPRFSNLDDARNSDRQKVEDEAEEVES
jgi:hypothetical protein